MSIPETPAGPRAGGAGGSVYAVIPSYGRAPLLRRALDSLASECPLLRRVILVDNGLDPAVVEVAEAADVATTVLRPTCNLGTAGGIAAGFREALAQPDMTHGWVLDDDAVAFPGALAAMVDAMHAADADAAAPLVLDEHGVVRWIPCRIPGKRRRWLSAGFPAEHVRRECGGTARTWDWAPWASVLLSRRAIESAGWPRIDLWSQYTDIEYLLRVTTRFRAVLAPRAVCQHLPPEANGASDAKLLAALQNGSFVACRLRHGRRALPQLRVQIYRYLRSQRWHPQGCVPLARALWRGAVMGEPTGKAADAAASVRAEQAWLGPLVKLSFQRACPHAP